MATNNTENFIIKFDVQGLEGTAAKVQAFNGNLEDMSKTIKNTPTEQLKKGVQSLGEGFDQLDTNIKETTTSFSQMKKELNGLYSEAARLEAKGDLLGAEKALKQAGKLKDAIGDLRAATAAYASDTRKLDAVVQGVTAITSAYQLAQGASILLGGSTKEWEKTLVKLNAVMAVANGLQQIQNLLQKESALSTQIIIPLQRAWTVAMEGTVGAARALRGALISTGIGALAVAIGYAISQIMDWIEADKLKKESQEELNKSIADGTDKINENRAAIENSLGKANATKIAEDAKTVKEAQKLLNDIVLETQSLLEIMAITNPGAIIFNKETQQYEASKKLRIEEIKSLQGTIDQLNQNLKQEANIRARLAEIRAEQIKKEKEKEKKDEIESLKEIKLLGYDEEEKLRQEEYEKRKKETEKNAWANAEVEMDIDAKLRNEKYNALVEEYKRVNGLKQKQAEEAAAYELSVTKTAQNAALSLAEQQAAAIFEINAANLKAITDLRLQSLDAQKDKELSNKRLTDKQRIEIEKKYQAEQNKIKLDAAKKQREAEVNQAIINGALAITNILANTVDPTGVLKAILVAQAVAATAIQVAKIKSTPLPQFAKGTRYVQGEGSETSDSIVARLSKGEAVITAKTNREYKPVLDAIHNGFIPADLLNSIALNYSGVRQSSKELNYDRLGKVIGKEIEQVMYYMDKKNNARTNIINVNVSNDRNHRKS